MKRIWTIIGVRDVAVTFKWYQALFCTISALSYFGARSFLFVSGHLMQRPAGIPAGRQSKRCALRLGHLPVALKVKEHRLHERGLHRAHA